MLQVDPALGRPFPIQDDLGVGESGNGYVLRMLGLNGIPYAALVKLVASPGHRYFPCTASKYLAYLFGANPLRMRRAIPERYKEVGQLQVRFMGCLLKRPYLIRRSAFPQICPLCLGDRGFAFSYWEISLTTACTIHEVRLQERCAGCGKLLSWRRPSLTRCICGEDVRQATCQPVAPEELAFSRAIRDRLDESAPEETGLRVRSDFDVLRGVSLDTLLRLVWCAGIKAVMPIGKVVPGTATSAPSCDAARAIVRRGMELLACVGQSASEQFERASSEKHAENLDNKDCSLWIGSGLAADLDYSEKQLVERLFPGFSIMDGGLGAADRQLALALVSTSLRGNR